MEFSRFEFSSAPRDMTRASVFSPAVPANRSSYPARIIIAADFGIFLLRLYISPRVPRRSDFVEKVTIRAGVILGKTVTTRRGREIVRATCNS